MSERALGFVENWISENIHAGADAPEGDSPEVKKLALKCVDAANAEGISELEIRESIDDLAAFIAGAIEEANEREAARVADKDD
jgi:hypothetical protein